MLHQENLGSLKPTILWYILIITQKLITSALLLILAYENNFVTIFATVPKTLMSIDELVFQLKQSAIKFNILCSLQFSIT